MCLFKYPGYQPHKKEHEAFKSNVLDFQRKFEDGRVSISEEVMVFMQDWLAKHILGTDKRSTLCP